MLVYVTIVIKIKFYAHLNDAKTNRFKLINKFSTS